MKVNLSSLSRISEDIACSVFDVLLQNFASPPKDIDIVAEKVAVELLKNKGYAANVYSEEAGHFYIGKDPQFTLVLDPLDGTKNYVSGLPVYAVSVALSSNPNASKIAEVDAVTIKTSLGTTFTATKGSSIKVNGRDSSKRCSNLVRIPYLTNLSSNSFPYRMFGASAIELCFVATGSFNFFVDEGTLKATDVAGAQLLINESGGRITDLNGSDISYNEFSSRNLSVLAATSLQLHTKLQRTFQHHASKM